MTTPHPIGNRDELRQKIIEMQKETLDNAKPMQELMVRAIEEDWDDERLRAETLVLVKDKLLDLRKDYAYYADKVVELFDAYTIEAEKRAELKPLADLAWCLGKLRGLGHPNEQMEKRWKLD